MTPLVTVLVPSRNEAADIADCLSAIAAQDHPLDGIEVLVVDGDSEDGTAAVAESILAEVPFSPSRVIRNSEATTPSNLNRGLAAARGEYVVRIDARSIVPENYVSTLVRILAERPEVTVVGAAQRAAARDGRPLSIGIARALNNRWSTGLARYRRTDTSGPADTVYLGAFRTEQLRTAGGWDTRFQTNQDFELNRRMSVHGLVWFVGGLPVEYRPRTSLRELWRQYIRFGRWKATYWSTTGDAPQLRQYVMLVAPVFVGGIVAAACAVRRSPKPLISAIGLGVAGLLAVERAGAAEPAGNLRSHLVGAAAITAVSGGWLVGVYSSLFATAVETVRSRR